MAATHAASTAAATSGAAASRAMPAAAAPAGRAVCSQEAGRTAHGEGAAMRCFCSAGLKGLKQRRWRRR